MSGIMPGPNWVWVILIIIGTPFVWLYSGVMWVVDKIRKINE